MSLRQRRLTNDIVASDLARTLAAYRRGDLVDAERFAAAVIASGRFRIGHLVRGVVRAQRGNSPGAANDLAVFSNGLETCHSHVRIVVDHARLVRTGRWDALETAVDYKHRTDASRRAHRAAIAAARGDVLQARNQLATLSDVTRKHDEIAVFMAALARCLVGLDVLDPSCLDAGRDALAMIKRRRIVDALLPVRALFHASATELAAVVGEDLDGTVGRADAFFDQARVASHVIEGFAWACASSTAHLASGNVANARVILERFDALQSGPIEPLLQPAMSVRRAWCELHRGGFQAARVLLADIPPDRTDDLRAQSYAELIDTYLGVVDGTMTGTPLADLAERWAREGRCRIAVDACSLAVGLGVPDRRGMTRIAGITRRVGRGYLTVLACHADALARQNSQTLERIGRAHLRAGRRSRAADAFAQAAGCQRVRDGSRLRALAAALLATCPEYWSPATAGLRAVDIDDDIDRAIGAGVVDGMTNDAIASRVYLSSSAVEQRLSRLYRRLGVRDRHELREFHAPMFAEPAGPPGSSPLRATRA